jgi:signal peptidase I
MLVGYHLYDKYGLTEAVIKGKSMEPTYYEKDITLFKEGLKPKDGDTAIFKLNDSYIVKRVIATAGDTIEIKDSQVYLNGELLNEEYLSDGYYDGGLIQDTELTLNEGEYFLMGDNRLVSHDSRVEGVFTDEDLVGTIVMTVEKAA